MKKLCAGLLCALLLGLCACGQAEPEVSTVVTTTSTAATTATETSTMTTEPSPVWEVPEAYHSTLDDYYLRHSESLGSLGYAVADINNDGIPELFLLYKNDSYVAEVMQSAYNLHVLYTIQNDKAVLVVDTIDFPLYDSILAADGTLFCASGTSTAFVNLYSCRLTPGTTELATLTEYHSVLKFSESPDSPPAPFWYKVVDGKEEKITEKQFNILRVAYKNPDKRIELKYIPFDATLPIEYPATYESAPKAYTPVLDELYRYTRMIQRGDDTIGVYPEWVFFDTPPNIASSYAINDINNDGTPELLVFSTYGEENHLRAIFTLKNNEPVSVFSFWDKHSGYLAADGTIFSIGSSGGGRSFLISYKLNPGATEFTPLTEYRSEYNLDYTTGDDYYAQYCYKVVNGKICYISVNEYDELMEKYRNPTNLMKLKFIPIEQ
jgi:hypothetical protein